MSTPHPRLARHDSGRRPRVHHRWSELLALLAGVALLILLMVGCAGGEAGAGLKDILAGVSGSLSASGCVDGGIKLTPDGVEVDWSVEACAKAEALGLDLVELCAGWER